MGDRYLSRPYHYHIATRRINNLASQGVVSVQKADEARAQRDAAAAAEQAAHEQYQQAVNGSRTEEKRAADARSAAAGAT